MKPLITDWPAFWRGFAKGVATAYFVAVVVLGVAWAAATVFVWAEVFGIARAILTGGVK